jgi:hypothetical protein
MAPGTGGKGMTMETASPALPSAERCVIITPSYRADFARVERLCASIDRHFRFAFEHILVVPQRDMLLFTSLAGLNRKVVSKQSVLRRHGFRFLPVPGRITVPGLFDRRFKEQWFHPRAGRISGWTIQQIIKLHAGTLCDAPVMMFIDSDVEIVRDTPLSAFLFEDQVRLHEHDAGAHLPSHRHWRNVARRLTGAPDHADSGRNYIGHMIVWRRDALDSLLETITRCQGMPWWLVLAREKNFSEYILYGVHARHRNLPGHQWEDLGLVHSLWVSGDAEAEAFRLGLTPRHVAVHIQSTLPIDQRQRGAILAQLGVAQTIGECA